MAEEEEKEEKGEKAVWFSESPGCKRMLPSGCHGQGGRVKVGRKGWKG